MKVYIVKEPKSIPFYYAWDKPLLGAEERVMPDFKWAKWKELQHQFDNLQKDMKAVFEDKERA